MIFSVHWRVGRDVVNFPFEEHIDLDIPHINPHLHIDAAIASQPVDRSRYTYVYMSTWLGFQEDCEDDKTKFGRMCNPTTNNNSKEIDRYMIYTGLGD